jgi:hypothetical protein
MHLQENQQQQQHLAGVGAAIRSSSSTSGASLRPVAVLSQRHQQ